MAQRVNGSSQSAGLARAGTRQHPARQHWWIGYISGERPWIEWQAPDRLASRRDTFTE